MNQTWENGKKKLILGPILACLASKTFFMGFTYTRCQTLSQAIIVISGKAYDQNLRKWQNPQFGPDLGLLGPNSGYQNYKNLVLSVTKYSQLSSCTILRKFSERPTDGQKQTDRQTDGQE